MTTASVVPALALPEGLRAPRSQSRGNAALPLARLTAPSRTDPTWPASMLGPGRGRGRRAGVGLGWAGLGWAPNARLDIRENVGLILVRPDAEGVFSITSQGHVRLPVTVRRWCGLGIGDQVLLAADTDTNLLVVYPPTALDALVTQASAVILGGGRS